MKMAIIAHSLIHNCVMNKNIKKGGIGMNPKKIKTEAIARDKKIEKRVEKILSQMTLKEKITMIGGKPNMSIYPNERIGVPEIIMSDGPMGVRCWGPATAFPAGIGLAASWNVEIAREVGRAMGRECRARGVHILLGPGVNIYRAPMCGRNFEYYGEDPYLASRTTVAFVQGVQEEGVVATAKHFACNNQEYDRHHTSSDVDERTLHEVYLAAFRAAVLEANVGAIMNSYNPLNGVHCSENRHLLTEILKHEWGFTGFVMSDWGSTYDGVAAANAGLDLEMPSASFMNAETLLPAIREGRVKIETIDDKVRRILRVIIRMGFLDRPQLVKSFPLYSADSSKTALDGAREGIVLLKNEKKILPLDRKRIKSLAVIGPLAHPAVPGGGGSSLVTPFRTASILDGIMHKAGKNITVHYSPDMKRIQNLAMQCDAAIICVGHNPATESEGFDRSFGLPEGQEQLIRAIARANPKTIVIVTAGGNVDIGSWLKHVAGLVHTWYPGQESGAAIAEILFGDVNPSGKLPATFEKRWEDNATYMSYHDQDKDKRVAYKEGVFIGYRHFDKYHKEPLFPFGFGLSYTKFRYSNLRLSGKTLKPGQSLKLSVDVTNTGRREGKEAIQLYVRDVKATVDRPVKELKGFAKISLKSGQKKTVHFTLDESHLSFYDVNVKTFKAEPGAFEVLVGSSSANICLKDSFIYEGR